MKFKLILAGLLCVQALTASAAPKKKKSSDAMEVVPTLWAAWMRGGMLIDGQNAQIDRASDNYFEDLNLGGSVELVLRNSSMVILGSVDYFDPFSSDVTVDGTDKGSLKSTELTSTLAVGYPLVPANNEMTFDVFVGLQNVKKDNTLNVGGSRTTNSLDIYDAVMMARMKFLLGSKLYLNIPVTYAGLGLSESDQYYDVAIQITYKMTDAFDIRMGYRISGHEYDENSENKWDTYQQGYTLGLGATF